MKKTIIVLLLILPLNNKDINQSGSYSASQSILIENVTVDDADVTMKAGQ